MADFVDLKVQFGVGPYHLNRYRVAFQGPPGQTSQMLANDFISRFPAYFNSSFATVAPQTRRYEGNITLKFHGFMKILGIDLGHPHHDWVVQGWMDPNLGFTAQTLQRMFTDIDDVEALPALLVSPLAADALGANAKHFLAGRRSWKLNTGNHFGLPATTMVLETAAVERFSCRTYEMTNIGNFTENKVPPIWISNLTNFVNRPNFKALPQAKPNSNWVEGKVVESIPINYLRMNFDNLDHLRQSPEFTDVMINHPDVIDVNAKAPSLWGKLERAVAF